jgi:DNA-binding transcriptional MerR regulator
MGLADDVVVRARMAAIPARVTPYSTVAVTARRSARGMLPSCRVPLADSQRLQAHLKSTCPAACSPSANWPAARESPPRPCATTRKSACSPSARISGQRRYPESAARLVGAILLYSDAGFTLAEQKALMASRRSASGEGRRLVRRKLAELDQQIAKAQAADDAIRHGLRRPYGDITRPNFNASITARLAGQPLSRSHQQLHGQRFREVTDSFWRMTAIAGGSHAKAALVASRAAFWSIQAAR